MMLALSAQEDHFHKMLHHRLVSCVALDFIQVKKLAPALSVLQAHPPQHLARESVVGVGQASFLIQVQKSAINVGLEHSLLFLVQIAQNIVRLVTVDYFQGAGLRAAYQLMVFAQG
jgi:hypothetical protein